MVRHLGIALLALCACSAHVERHARWVLADGRTLVDLSHGEEPYVVLIMAPDDAFACAGVVAEWLEWRRRAPNSFHLVFSRAPSRAERRRLATVRLPLAGTLAGVPPDSTPVEMLVSRGRIVHLGRGVRTAHQSRLLGPLRSHATEVVVGRMEDGPQPLTHGGTR